MLNKDSSSDVPNSVEPPAAVRQSGLGTDHFGFDPEGVEQELVGHFVALRERSGMSQNELAKRAQDNGLAFHQPTIQRIETGQRPLRVHEAAILAQILGTSLIDLLSSYMSPASAERMYYDELRRSVDSVRAAEERIAQEQRLLRLHHEELDDAESNYRAACAATGTAPRTDYDELARRLRLVLSSMSEDLDDTRRGLRVYAAGVQDIHLKPLVILEADRDRRTVDGNED